MTAQASSVERELHVSWYYARGQEQAGPVEEAEFHRLIAAGEITPQTYVWRAGMANWAPLAQVQADAAASAPPAPMGEPEYGALPQAVASEGETHYACVQCGRVFPASNMVNYQGQNICAECKPLYFQRIREGVSTGMEYAGFWIRFVASVIDSILMWVVQLVLIAMSGILMTVVSQGEEPNAIAMIIGVAFQAFSLLLFIGYKGWFHGRFGQTLGKMAVGVKVVRSNGDPLTYGRAVGRAFAEILSGLTLSIGYIIAAFDSEKRALHDHICDTRVVRK